MIGLCLAGIGAFWLGTRVQNDTAAVRSTYTTIAPTDEGSYTPTEMECQAEYDKTVELLTALANTIDTEGFDEAEPKYEAWEQQHDQFLNECGEILSVSAHSKIDSVGESIREMWATRSSS